MPIDIPDGIERRFEDTPSMAWVVGGMTEGLVAKEKTAEDLYISFHDTTSSSVYSTYHKSFVMELVYQFDCFAVSRHDARRMADRLVDIYHPGADNIPTAEGLIFGMSAMPGGGMDDPGMVAKSGKRLYKFTRDFTFTVRKTRTT